MKIVTLAAAAAVLTLTLAGCGGGSAAQHPDQGPALQDAAKSAGCTNLVRSDSPTMFASAEGTCTWHGQTIDLVVFQTGTLKQNWIKVASQFGPILEQSDRWAATTG